jgi:NAD(P)H-dependent flavin oxidoreductase YrpB (nitropropane dioxygenase family)
MGAVARHELAAAVSEAGGLGTIAGARAAIAAEVEAARRLTGRPVRFDTVGVHNCPSPFEPAIWRMLAGER